MELSKTTRDKAKSQVIKLFNESGINCIGQSKYNAKQEQLSNSVIKSRDIHKDMGIYGIETGVKYQKIWTQLLVQTMEKYNISDIKELKAQHINSFLTSHSDKAKKTLSSYISAVNKLETALNWNSQKEKLHRNYDFQAVIKKHDEVARAKVFDYKNRTYTDVPKLIENIDNSLHKFVAELQYITGARISEITHINISQLNGNKLYYNSKGGKEMVKTLPTYIRNQLEDYCRLNNGLFTVNQGSYRHSLKKSAELTNQTYAGSHGIRWTYAKNMYDAKIDKLFSRYYVQYICEKAGLDPEYVKANIFTLKHKEIVKLRDNQIDKILRQVSEALGHNRPDITMHYIPSISKIK